ncbi:MAG: TIGR03808 family TAT-translocated repetitive protein [Rhizobiales bacterium]|nr:TIGR03808 family TAT-translocated repetitive protein [Hyphomicrobiales bacterium]
MSLDRRQFLTATAAGATALAAAPVLSAPLSKFGLDAGSFGVRPGSPDDQSRALQRAIDRAAGNRVPLMLAPGDYKAGDLKLPTGANVVGVRGATRLVSTSGLSLFTADHADTVSLTGLVLDGGGLTLPDRRGLVYMVAARGIRITDCAIIRAGGNGIVVEQSDGSVTHTTISDAANVALFSRDALGLIIASNVIRGSGNGGIHIWQSDNRDDGSKIVDNRVEDTSARAGGSGQNGNAINIFRAANVIVRGNHIRNAAFSAVRGNAASNIQIVGNNCGALDEAAIYSEFAFEGAVIADNIVDGAGTGVSVTNFNDGGRLATVRGNLIRNVAARRPGTPEQEEGIGITVEADTTVSGNVIETAANAGISAGWGTYLRNVAVTGNVVRAAGYGVAVSVSPGAGDAVIASNIISGARRAAIVGMDHRTVVTGDLAKGDASRYPQLRIHGNQVS